MGAFFGKEKHMEISKVERSKFKEKKTVIRLKTWKPIQKQRENSRNSLFPAVFFLLVQKKLRWEGNL